MAADRGGSYKWYALGLLAFLNVLNYLDRNVIFGLFEPIKRDLGITDSQLGWLGAAYVLLFSVAAFPFGLLSDLRSRRAVVAAGVAIWSTFTALGGLVKSFTQLFVMRAAVGVGSAAFGPASNSLVADYFPGQRRALAFGILMAGVPVGGALGFWLGGQLEVMYGWRVAFFAVGVPGLFLAALAARLVDPCRTPEPVTLKRVLARFEVGASALLRQFAPLLVAGLIGTVAAYYVDRRYGASSAADAAVLGTAVGIGLAVNIGWWLWRIRKDRIADTPFGPQVTGPVGDVLEELHRAFRVVLRTPTLFYVFLAGAMISFGLNGLVGWGPTFASRALGWDSSTATRELGVLAVVAGSLGTLVGGVVADWLRPRTDSSRILATAIGMLIGGPIAFYTLTVRDPVLFVRLFAVAFFFLTWYNGPLSAMIFDVVPNRISASVVGAYMMFIHLAGDAVALPLVGILSDRIGIDRAILVLPAVSIAGGLVVLMAGRSVRRDMERATLPTAEFQAVI